MLTDIDFSQILAQNNYVRTFFLRSICSTQLSVSMHLSILTRVGCASVVHEGTKCTSRLEVARKLTDNVVAL